MGEKRIDGAYVSKQLKPQRNGRSKSTRARPRQPVRTPTRARARARGGPRSTRTATEIKEERMKNLRKAQAKLRKMRKEGTVKRRKNRPQKAGKQGS